MAAVALNAAADPGRSGVRDWLLQRGSALVLGAYTVFLSVFLLLHPDLNYAVWSELFSALWVQLFSAVTLLAFVVHAWVGLWTVATDYLTDRMLGAWGTPVRLSALFALALLLLSGLGFGLRTLWL